MALARELFGSQDQGTMPEAMIVDPDGLSRLALVAMVKSSDLRNRHDAPAFWFLHGSRFRSIFGQRQMSSGVLVVGKITSQSPAQRSFIPHDDVVQAFPANGTDQPLHKRILPWRSRRGNHFLYPQAFRHFYPVIPGDRIAVAQKISAPLVPGKRFPDLLHRPILAGVVGHLEVQHTTSSMR